MKKVIVVGGGIIGLSSAYYLKKAGCDVTVIESGDEADGISASYGNAGMLAPSHFVPLASPGIISKGLKWMLDSTSPFYIKPRLNWDLISWGMKFMRSATKENVNRSMRFLKEINQESLELYRQMNKELSFDFNYRDAGLLMLCKTQGALKEEEKMAVVAQGLGLDAKVLNKEEVNRLEPDLHPDVIGAVMYPGDGFLSPIRLLNGLKRELKSMGVQLVYHTKITHFDMGGNKINAIGSDKTVFKADEYVITAGVWSTELIKKTGVKLPMQGGKGYNVTIDNPQTQINYPAILVEAKSAVSPFAGKLRLAGTMEIDGYNLGITQKRVDTIINTASDYYQFKDTKEFNAAKPWAGLRPVTPDGLPYLGRINGFNNLAVATGHAMMGLSLGPISGKLISEIITEQPLSFDLTLMNPERFS